MNIKKIFAFLLTITMLSTFAQAQTNKAVKDYLSIPGPVVIEGKSYNLSWSSHPAANFYKQEYLVKGDDANRFKTMIMVDVVTGNTNIKEVVAGKIAELKKAKETNPMVNYESFDNPKTGEYMLDFLLTANAADGKMDIAERNVYRYKIVTDKSGQTGILLFGVSVRSYGNNIDTFLNALKGKRKALVTEVAQYKIPEIKISK